MKIVVRDKNNIPTIISQCKKLKGKEIWIGIEEGRHSGSDISLKQLAGIHEYGCRIQVTPKMRAWLHHNGLHLKKSTNVIVIPERSFMRAGYDQNEKKFLDSLEKQLEKAIVVGIDIDTLLESNAETLADKISDFARDLRSPANHPFTIKRKGSSNPLVNTGQLIGSIKGKVK